MTVHAIVDLRIYTIRLRKMAEFIGVFDRLAMAVQLKYLPLGMFTSAVGPHHSGTRNCVRTAAFDKVLGSQYAG
jgi:hypothetical protein